MKFPKPGPMVMLKQPSSGASLSAGNRRQAVMREPVVKLNIEGWGSGSRYSWS